MSALNLIDEKIKNNFKNVSNLEMAVSNSQSVFPVTAELAAQELANLTALLKEAGEVLEPFEHEDLSERLSGNNAGDKSVVFQRNNATLHLGDFRRAAEIRKKIQEVLP